MKIEFDLAKSDQNNRSRKLPFDKAAEFDWSTAVYEVDDRIDYGEKRIIALGFLGVRLHVICFKEIEGGIRIISFRKANIREVNKYEKAINR
jgi:uncharacterized DUF497 family protein